ncbi:MAG: acyltransferase [Patescibacteria group bacterium]|nr:acyltransferase [Patescibacteria group bacterium]MDD5491028.1 acyltransferase [Patescibacteria group bacterium]
MADGKNILIHLTVEVSPEAEIGEGTRIWQNSQIREGAKIGRNCILGRNVYVDSDVVIGNNVKVQSNVIVCRGLIIEDGVFIGPYACFVNDKSPRAINPDESLKTNSDWEMAKTIVKKGASIGANVTLTGGLTVGEFSLIGAGALITKDTLPFGLYIGHPAKLVGYVCKCGKRLENKCPVCEMSLADIKKEE